MSVRFADRLKRYILPWLRVGLLLAGLIWLNLLPSISGDRMGLQALQLSDNTVGATSIYKFDFTLVTPGTLGSILFTFCASDPEVGNPCTLPAGLDVSGVALSDQQPVGSGFSIGTGTNANNIVLTRPAAPSGATPYEFSFTNAVNPSTSGSYFVRIQTFASEDTTGTSSDFGGIAFAITNAVNITATVPPYLIFCTAITIPNNNCSNTTGDFLDFGELSTTQTRSGTSQMLAATNAELGYSVTLAGSTMASGTNFIPAIASDDVSRPGTGQFGFNMRANAAPAVGANPVGPGLAVPTAGYNLPNQYQFNNGDIVVSNATTDDVRRFTSSYIVNVPNGQAAGIYVSTITYICLANF